MTNATTPVDSSRPAPSNPGALQKDHPFHTPSGPDYPSRVLTDMSTGVLVIDGRGNIVYINPPAARMLEFDVETLSGSSVFSTISRNRENDTFNDYILEAIQLRDVTHTGMVTYSAPSGRKYAFNISSSYLNSADPQSQAGAEIVMTFTDETEAVEFHRKFTDSSRCFVIGISCVCIWSLIASMWEFMGRPISVDFLTHGAEVMGLVMMVLIFRYTSFTTKELGITMENPKKTLGVGLSIALASTAFLALIKLIGQTLNPNLFNPGAPFIDFSRFTWRQLSYILTAGVQEFIARSILQNNIRRILVGRHIAFTAIILASLIFAALHIQHGFFFMVGAAVLGALEGILYEKQQNIYGVWIVHWFFGVAGTLLGLVTISH